MKRALIFLSVLQFFLMACKQNSKTNEQATTANADTTRYFQIKQFIQTQIEEVNRTPFFIYKLDRINEKQDSVAIDKEAFNKLAAIFLKPDINDPAIKKDYKENIFHDATTKSFTISYATTNKNLEIQNAEILLQEDGETAKRIFIRKFINYPDSSIIEQLGWKPGESFQINTLVQKKDNSETSRQTTVVWNEKN